MTLRYQNKSGIERWLLDKKKKTEVGSLTHFDMTHLGSVANTGEIDGFYSVHKRFVVKITFAKCSYTLRSARVILYRSGDDSLLHVVPRRLS